VTVLQHQRIAGLYQVHNFHRYECVAVSRVSKRERMSKFAFTQLDLNNDIHARWEDWLIIGGITDDFFVLRSFFRAFYLGFLKFHKIYLLPKLFINNSLRYKIMRYPLCSSHYYFYQGDNFYEISIMPITLSSYNNSILFGLQIQKIQFNDYDNLLIMVLIWLYCHGSDVDNHKSIIDYHEDMVCGSLINNLHTMYHKQNIIH
jgi:hypothetical protein